MGQTPGIIGYVARPLWHIVCAAPVMVLTHLRLGPRPAMAAGLSAVLIDGDHLVDWALNGGRVDYSRRIVVPLHGWEYPAVLLGLARGGGVPLRLRGTAVALGAGWLAHLVLDTLVNRPRTPAGYSLLYRLVHRFRREPSGWLQSSVWTARYGTNRRRAPREAAVAVALATLFLLVCPPGSAG